MNRKKIGKTGYGCLPVLIFLTEHDFNIGWIIGLIIGIGCGDIGGVDVGLCGRGIVGEGGRFIGMRSRCGSGIPRDGINVMPVLGGTAGFTVGRGAHYKRIVKGGHPCPAGRTCRVEG